MIHFLNSFKHKDYKMADKGSSEGFVLPPPDHQDARLSDNNTSELKNPEAEYNRVKRDFLRIARNNR